MAAPVVFSTSTDDDFEKFVSEEEEDDLVDTLSDRLGAYPYIGKSLPPPEAFARTTQHGKWRVYYEIKYGEDGESIVEVEVLRIIPSRWGKPKIY